MKTSSSSAKAEEAEEKRIRRLEVQNLDPRVARCISERRLHVEDWLPQGRGDGGGLTSTPTNRGGGWD